MSNVNRIVYGTGNGQGFEQIQAPVNNSTFPIAQGDLVYMDTTAHILKPVLSDANAAALAGVALQPSAVSSNLDNGTVPAQSVIQVGWACVASLKTTVAETYYTGTSVYAGADAQTVTTVAGTNKIGVVVLPSGVSSVTGATGVSVPLRVLARAFSV